MTSILVLNGPNLNLLGLREPAVYGSTTLADVEKLCRAEAESLGLGLEFRQSNHEGVLVDWIQEAGQRIARGELIGVVFNPAAYTHTSVALHDAIKGASVRLIEVHISNVHAREPFRHHSYVSPAAAGIIVGLGVNGYAVAIQALARMKGLRLESLTPMRKSIATVSLSGSLEEKLQAIAAAGFDAIELFENDFIHYPGSARDLGRMAAGLGLGIDLYQPFRDFEGMPDDLFRRSLERAERKFDVMQEMGCPLLLCCSNTSPLALADAGRSAAQLHELAERAARRGLKVGYEALAWGRHVRLYGQAWALVEQAGHDSLGLILDSFHTLSLGDDPAGIASIPGDRIFFLQMADAPLLQMDVIQWARHHRNFPGQGQLDVEDFFYQTLRSGYCGNLSLEIFNDVFRETPNRRTAVDAMRSLLFLEDGVRQRLAGEGRAGASQAVGLFEPPARQQLGGVAFVEFAVDESSSQTLGDLFQAMGFMRAGRHRSKKAELYRQGDAALILNAEPGSFARARFGSYGPSVCAIGILADDPQGVVERAVALRSARFDSPIGPDEVPIPSIVSPGGIVLHVVPTALGRDGLFAADFVLDGAAGPSGKHAGITGLDHLALGMTLDQRDTWMLFARAVLGLAPGAAAEFADPFGLVSSTGVGGGGRELRFVFHVSQSRRTDTARQAHAQGGVAVHHISLGCADIFAAARALRAQGVRLVPVSRNYYDDLAARTDLPEALIGRMADAGIVFDRSADGDYFHFYTDTVGERFYFEIVQRVAGYDAYGGVNAAVRSARR